MANFKSPALVFLGIFCTFCAAAQPTGKPAAPAKPDTIPVEILFENVLPQADFPQDLMPWKPLPLEDKLRLLEYVRTLGLDIDREIEFGMEQLDSMKREKANFYIQTMLMGTEEPKLRTYVQWSADTVYVGRVLEGTTVLDSVTVTNIGTNPYIIRSIKTKCDCTVIRYPKFPVMPGEKVSLRIEFDSSRKLGPFIGAIVIYDNSRPNLRTIIYIKGEVVAR